MEGRVEVNLDPLHQRSGTAQQGGVDAPNLSRMYFHIARQEGQKLSDHWIDLLASLRAGQEHRAIRSHHVSNLVALAQFERATYGIGHRRLVTVGQRRFDFKRGHNGFREDVMNAAMVMQTHYHVKSTGCEVARMCGTPIGVWENGKVVAMDPGDDAVDRSV